MLTGITTEVGMAGFEPFSKSSADQPRNTARDTRVAVCRSLFALAVCLVLMGCDDGSTTQRDNSDPPGGFSGMVVLTDNLTGCQYLKRFYSAPIPRMEAHGDGQRQICKRENH